MIASADAAAYSVLLLDVFLRYQMIANRRKTRNSHLIDTRSQNQSYGIRITITDNQTNRSAKAVQKYYLMCKIVKIGSHKFSYSSVCTKIYPHEIFPVR